MAKKKNSGAEKFTRGLLVFADLLLSVSLVGFGAFTLKALADRVQIVGSAEIIQTEDTSEEEENAFMADYQTLSTDSDAVHEGDLILVNNDYAYVHTGEEKLVEIGKTNEDTGFDWVKVNEPDYKILDIVYRPMAEMMKGFIDATELDTVMIYGSYRSTEFQQKLYDADLAETGSAESTLVAKPGYSEHETGYAFDFTRTTDFDYDGEGEYEWFAKHCADYGFVLRYPEGKENLTYIKYEPWHFRYVGIPHAVYMTRYNLCLEEYLALVKSTYSFDGIHLEIIDDEGKNYEVYYVPTDTTIGVTEVPVPKTYAYNVSGNNTDGFIVTVDKSSVQAEIPTEAVEDTTGEATTEETSETASE